MYGCRCRKEPVTVSAWKCSKGVDAYFVINAESLVRVLNQLMYGEGGIIGLDDSVGDLWRRDNREGGHHTIWELLANLGDQQGSHTSTSTASERVGDLETLQAVAAFGFTTNNVKDLINKLCSLSVMALGPIVSSPRLTKDEVVWTEELTERTSSDRIHCTRFQVDEDGARDIFIVGCLQGLSEQHALMPKPNKQDIPR